MAHGLWRAWGLWLGEGGDSNVNDWRRERDSNPRWLSPRLFSRQLPSTGLGHPSASAHRGYPPTGYAGPGRGKPSLAPTDLPGRAPRMPTGRLRQPRAVKGEARLVPTDLRVRALWMLT